MVGKCKYGLTPIQHVIHPNNISHVHHKPKQQSMCNVVHQNNAAYYSVQRKTSTDMVPQ